MENNGSGKRATSKRRPEMATDPNEASSCSGNQPILPDVLRMLEAYAKKASIELSNNQKVSIQKRGKVRTVLHCGEQETACKHVVPSGGLGLCEKFARVGNGLGPFDETEKTRQRVVEILVEAVQALNVEEKAKLLSAMGEEEFGAYAERNGDIEKLQSIQYKFTRRVNDLREKRSRKPPKRPIIEQRKVGDYLYKRQAGPKGGIYWYLQFTKDGKRNHVYLGKANPTFEPTTDLARKQNGKSHASLVVNTPPISHQLPRG